MSTKKSAYRPTKRPNPFAAMVGMTQYIGNTPGHAKCEIEVGPKFYSPAPAVHGGLLFAIMDNDMGAALTTTLAPDEGCATIEMKINYLKPVIEGKLVSSTRVLQKGKRIAVLESTLRLGKTVVAIATSTYAIYKPAVPRHNPDRDPPAKSARKSPAKTKAAGATARTKRQSRTA